MLNHVIGIVLPYSCGYLSGFATRPLWQPVDPGKDFRRIMIGLVIGMLATPFFAF